MNKSSGPAMEKITERGHTALGRASKKAGYLSIWGMGFVGAIVAGAALLAWVAAHSWVGVIGAPVLIVIGYTYVRINRDMEL